MKKIKVKNYFLYKQCNGILIGEIIKKKSTVGTSYHGKDLFIYKIIYSDNINFDQLGSEDRFSDNSDMFDNCVVGKSIDELWLRMI